MSRGRIICIKYKRGTGWEEAHSLVPSCCNTVNFTITVKLIAEEVGKYGNAGRDNLNNLGDYRFINLKDSDGLSRPS